VRRRITADGGEEQQSWRQMYNNTRDWRAKSLKFWVRWPPGSESNFIPAHYVDLHLSTAT